MGQNDTKGHRRTSMSPSESSVCHLAFGWHCQELGLNSHWSSVRILTHISIWKWLLNPCRRTLWGPRLLSAFSHRLMCYQSCIHLSTVCGHVPNGPYQHTAFTFMSFFANWHAEVTIQMYRPAGLDEKPFTFPLAAVQVVACYVDQCFLKPHLHSGTWTWVLGMLFLPRQCCQLTGGGDFKYNYLAGDSLIWIQKRFCVNRLLFVANETRSLAPPAEKETSKSPSGKAVKSWNSWKLPSDAIQATASTWVS